MRNKTAIERTPIMGMKAGRFPACLSAPLVDDKGGGAAVSGGAELEDGEGIADVANRDDGDGGGRVAEREGSGGNDVERVPIVIVEITKLDRVVVEGLGNEDVEVAAGRGESKEPVISSRLR